MRIAIDIHSTPQLIFRHLNEESLVPQWMDGLQRVEFEGGKKGRLPGARFRYVVRQLGQTLLLDGTILRFRPDEHLAVRLTTRQFSIDADFTLEIAKSVPSAPPQNGPEQTRLIYSAELNEQSSLPRLLATPFYAFLRNMTQSQLKRLKQVCEHHQSSVATSAEVSKAPTW
ncbi:MAG: hypothetical protein C5B49_04760 [Bdellovibrio sp.]|nr:MAG: hypothetical protein C5B49_04760 [Bdellovibrio sp.]